MSTPTSTVTANFQQETEHSPRIESFLQSEEGIAVSPTDGNNISESENPWFNRVQFYLHFAREGALAFLSKLGSTAEGRMAP